MYEIFKKRKRNFSRYIHIYITIFQFQDPLKREYENRLESINKATRIGAFVAPTKGHANVFSCSPFCGESPGARFSFGPTVINAPLGQSTVKKRAKEERERGGGSGLMCLNEPLILERRVH